MEQNRIDISGFLETMDQMCQSMRGAEDNMANQFALQTDEELDPQLEAMTLPAHYLTASQSPRSIPRHALLCVCSRII